MATVKEIVTAALKVMGADGLCCPGECGCGLDDLMSCFDGSCSVCVPAKEALVPEELQDDCDRYFVPLTDEEIAANLNKKLCHDMSCGNPDHDGEGHCHCIGAEESHKMGGADDEL